MTRRPRRNHSPAFKAKVAVAARGLTGDQGVLIPKSNIEHLMLRSPVVEAAEAGKFRVIPVETIDQGIAILTGTDADARGKDGRYPDGSVNALVETRLRNFAKTLKAFSRSEKPDEDGKIA